MAKADVKVEVKETPTPKPTDWKNPGTGEVFA